MGAVLELGAKQWDEKVVRAPGLILLDFYAPWCGPCQAFKPVLEEVAGEMNGGCAFFKINIDKEERLTELMKVTTVPTLILVRNGSEVARNEGAMPKRSLVSQLKKFIPA